MMHAMVGSKISTLTFLLAGCWLLFSCQDPEKDSGSTRRRVEAVLNNEHPVASKPEWCDVFFEGDRGPMLSLPANFPIKKGGDIHVVHPSHWVWLNFWATWCKPCLREMPLIQEFGKQLRTDGIALDNWFFSLDDQPEELARYLGQHPAIATSQSLRISDPDDFPAWIAGLGLSADTTIPVNLLIAPGGKIRCVRTGSISESDFARIRAAFR
jgi:thiol-disulfide isomerase/thioredoxin